MENGTPIFDRLGPWFTLAGFGKRPSEALVAAVTKRGLPLKVTQFKEPELIRVYGSQLLLVRPDQHIAWRGVACDSPRDADAIITRVLGWETSSMISSKDLRMNRRTLLASTATAMLSAPVIARAHMRSLLRLRAFREGNQRLTGFAPLPYPVAVYS
jgi:hypothetical protein